jgi:hypothetical protein
MLELELEIMRLRSDLATGVAGADLKLPVAVEPLAQAHVARSLARSGAAGQDATRIERAAALVAELPAGVYGLLVDLHVQEVLAIRDADGDALAQLAARWEDRGFERDAAWCRHLSRVYTRPDVALVALSDLHVELAALGARMDAAIVAAGLPHARPAAVG